MNWSVCCFSNSEIIFHDLITGEWTWQEPSMLRSKTCPSLMSSISFSVCLSKTQYLSLETLITNTGTRFKTYFFLSRLLVASVKCFLDSLYFLQGSSHSHRSLVVQSRCVTNLIFLRNLQSVQFFCCCCCTKS